MTGEPQFGFAFRVPEESAEDLFEEAPCGYLYTSPAGHILRVNRTFLQWTGYTPADLGPGRKFSDLLTGGGRIFHETHYAPLLRVQGHADEIALDIRRRDGSLLPALITAVQKQDPAGQPLFNRVTVFNATERRRYEQDLLDARRQAEQVSGDLTAVNRALTESQRQLQMALHAAREVIWTWVPHNNLMRMTGALELLSAPCTTLAEFLDLVHAEERETLEQDLQRCRDSGDRFRAEFRLRRPSGVYFWVEARGQQDQTGITGTLIDVDEQQVARHKLKTSEAFNRAILESTEDRVYVLDEHGRILFGNTAAHRCAGRHGIEGIFGRDWADFWSGADRIAAARAISGGLMGQTGRFQARAGSERGELQWFDLALTPLHAVAGERRLLAIGRDITEQKRFEQRLREGEDHLRRVLDAMVAFVCVLSPDGIIRRVNRTALEMTGLESAALEGRPFAAIPCWRRGETANLLPALELARGGAANRSDFSLGVASAEERTLDLYLAPMFGPAGGVTHIVAFGLDVTDRRRAQEELRKANESLLHSNEELGQFVWAASHDLQEPLRTVALYSQLLERKLKASLDQDSAAYLDRVISEAKRMSTLLSDLLVLSQSGSSPVGLRSVPIEQPLRVAIANLNAAIVETGAKVMFDELPAVRIDAGRVAQVFQNLIGNAIKYRRGGVAPEIEIFARREPGMHVFTVRDNGMGFSPEYASQIFGMFKRLHGREIPGTGIGLAICRKVIEAHGGQIWADSIPGTGSTFCFSIPD